MNTSPIVSIIIPLFNRLELIGHTLTSILNQSYVRWEAIVVDDGSTDGSYEYVNEICLSETRIKLFKRNKDIKGASVCRNIGIENASGEYLIFLDSDDLLLHTCIEKRVFYFHKNQELDFAVFQTLVFSKEPYDTNIFFNIKTSESDIRRFLNMDIPWHTCSVIWKRQSIIELGKWDENLLSWQDWELHVRALIYGLKYNFLIAEPDSFIRHHPNTIGLVSTSEAHLHSHIKMLTNINYLLRQYNRADLLNLRRLAGVFFWVSNQWYKKRKYTIARSVWSQCHSEKIISLNRYILGLLFLSTHRIPVLHSVISRGLNLIWRDSIKKFSGNFKSVRFIPNH